MKSLTCLIDAAAVIVADASTVINLNATGCASEILRVLPNRLVVAKVVEGELEDGRARGWQDAKLLNDLVALGLVEIVTLTASADQHYERLIIGPAASTLDDGEAATIAHAVDRSAIAVIDEKRAIKICGQRFPELRIGCTVDILAHPEVHSSLGTEVLATAVFNALSKARMRVLPHHLDWVIQLIGNERASACPSLPSSIRSRCL